MGREFRERVACYKSTDFFFFLQFLQTKYKGRKIRFLLFPPFSVKIKMCPFRGVLLHLFTFQGPVISSLLGKKTCHMLINKHRTAAQRMEIRNYVKLSTKSQLNTNAIKVPFTNQMFPQNHVSSPFKRGNSRILWKWYIPSNISANLH